MQRARIILVVVAISLVGAGTWLVATQPRNLHAADAPAPVLPPPALLLATQGTSTCASMACHNANGPPGSWRSEYTTWANCDPHARAYEVLFDDRSREIEKNLKGLKDLDAAHPEHNTLCLSCHVQQNIAVSHFSPKFTVADGVGCESCHGPAQKWLSLHYQPEWQALSPMQKQALGFNPTKDLTARATICAGCHVGRGDADVNHDLIAAGHPRLRFEFAAYHANYPKHWSEKKDKARYPDFEARAWLIGQLTSAAAAAELLAHRAESKDKPWPEFAEYGCFSCHHDLQAKPWRQRGANRPLGVGDWGSWYFATLPEMPASLKACAPQAEAIRTRLKGLMDRQLPDRAGVATDARRLAQGLSQWLSCVGPGALDKPVVAQTLAALAADRRQLTKADWDGVTQLYLGMAALYHGLGDCDPMYRDNVALKTSLHDLSRHLDAAFIKKDDMSRYDSPRNYDPVGAEEHLTRIRGLLPAPPASR